MLLCSSGVKKSERTSQMLWRQELPVGTMTMSRGSCGAIMWTAVMKLSRCCSKCVIKRLCLVSSLSPSLPRPAERHPSRPPRHCYLLLWNCRPFLLRGLRLLLLQCFWPAVWDAARPPGTLPVDFNQLWDTQKYKHTRIPKVCPGWRIFNCDPWFCCDALQSLFF